MNLHHLGLAHRLNHDLAAASRAFSEAVTIFDGSPDTRSFAVYPLKNLGMIEEAYGWLRRAEQIYRHALEHAIVREQPLPSAGHAYLCLGRLAYEWNNLPTAADYLRQAIELGRRGNLHQIIAEAAIELAPVVLAQESFDAVEGVLEESQDAAGRWQDPWTIARAAASRARVRLLQGRTTEAIHWFEGARLDLDQIGEVDLRHLTAARLLLARGQHDEAQHLLHRLATHAEAGGYLRSALEALALLVVAQHEAGDKKSALATLTHALQLAAPEGYMRTFLDAGPAIAAVLEAGVRQSAWGGGSGEEETIRHYARTLLSHMPLRATSAVLAAPPSQLIPPDVEPLTVRELEVLHLIAAGKSNGEIATTMVVAVSTVKAHINSIFGKLGVTSRTQALVRARELQLF
jgi:LuxR family maltose regulon positive regulatory protein